MGVYKDDKTASWFCKFYFKDWQGDRHQTTKRGYKTKRDALRWQADFIAKENRSIQSIGSEVIASNKNIDDEQLEQLLYYFRKVKAYSDIATDKNDMPNFKNELFQFLNQLDKGEQDKLCDQLTDFVNTFHYYNRRW